MNIAVYTCLNYFSDSTFNKTRYLEFSQSLEFLLVPREIRHRQQECICYYAGFGRTTIRIRPAQ